MNTHYPYPVTKQNQRKRLNSKHTAKPKAFVQLHLQPPSFTVESLISLISLHLQWNPSSHSSSTSSINIFSNRQGEDLGPSLPGSKLKATLRGHTITGAYSSTVYSGFDPSSEDECFKHPYKCC